MAAPTVFDNSYRALFAIPSLRRIILSMTLGRLASSMVSVAVILFSLERYNSPALTGIVTFASMFPSVIASPFAGALLDRHGRARMVILDYLIGAGLLLLLGVLATFDLLPPWALVGLVGLAAFSNPLSNSGLRSLMPMIVPRHLWTRMNAADSNSYVVAQLVGPPIAGAMAQFAGPVIALSVIGVLLLLAAFTAIGIPEPKMAGQTSGRLLTDAGAGLRYVIGHPTLRGLAIAMSTLRIGSGIQAIVMPIIVLRVIGAGPAVVGLAFGASAIAGFVGALLMGRIDTTGRERQFLALFWSLTTLGFVFLLFTDNLLLVFVAMALTGFLNGPADVTMFTIRQRRTDPAWFGRAFAVSSSFNFAGYPIGTALAGAIVDQALLPAIWLAMVLSIMGGILAWVLIPQHDDPQSGHGRTSVRN